MRRCLWQLVVLMSLGWVGHVAAQTCAYVQPASERAPTVSIPPAAAPALSSVPAAYRKEPECFATNWVRRLSSTWWGAITYGPDRFVMIGSNNTSTAYSFDGVSWTTAGSGSTGYSDVEYGNGIYVGVSGATNVSNNVLTSTNGVNWVSRPSLPVSLSWAAITYGNGLFVAVASSDTAVSPVMTSPDGINWTQRSAPFNVAWNDVIYANGQFVAVGDAATGTNGIMTSPDGMTWTNRSGGSNFMSWEAIAYGNGLYVAVGVGGGSKIMTSPDGITWTNRSTPGLDLFLIAFGKDMFVAGASGRMMVSRDGITWPSGYVTTGGSSNSGGMAYGAGRFVIAYGSTFGGVLVSDD